MEVQAALCAALCFLRLEKESCCEVTVLTSTVFMSLFEFHIWKQNRH